MSPRTSTILLVLLVLVGGACTRDTGQSTTTSSAPAVDSSPTTTSVPAPTTTTEPAPEFEPASCEFTEPAGRTVECGWVEVPEDRSDPETGTVRLHVAVFRSESDNPAPDPVVFLEGGPGGDSLETVPLTFEDRFAHLLADRDLIMYDQRGTGYSEPSLACPELRELGFELIDDDLPAEELLRLQLASTQDCRDRLTSEGVALGAYTSAASAADLADLRRALGYDEWNLYGLSYGTRLARTVTRDHPQGIRAVVLDSTYPIEADIVAEAPRNLDHSLRTLFDGCSADQECSAAYPRLEETFYALLERLEEEPLRAPVTDVFTGDVYDAVFSGGSLGAIVFQSLYSEDAITFLPLMIDHIAAGDTYELTVLTSSLLANGEFMSAGMQLSVQCREEVPFSSPSAVGEAIDDYPRLEPIFAGLPNLGPGVFEVCDTWAPGDPDPIEDQPIASAIPTLVLAGEFDPVTPPYWGRQATDGFGRATFVEFPGFGHGPSASGECPQSILRAFLNAPEDAVDVSCVDTIGPPAFVTPGLEPPNIVLVPFREQMPGATVAGLVPEGWEQQAPGVWARGLSDLDQTAVVQQAAAGATAPIILQLLADQFGLGDSPEPVGEYDSSLGTWVLYEGSVVGARASVGLLEVDGGTLLVILVSPPSENEALRTDVFFPAMGAISAG